MSALPAPAPLRSGDRVAVLAPSSTVPHDRVASGVQTLSSWGLEPVLGQHAFDIHPCVPHLAGTDEDRAADLVTAWEDPAIRAIFCARGGYGSQRLLAQLPAGALEGGEPAHVVGFSDATPLLHRVAREAGVRSVHGPVVTTIGEGDGDPGAVEHLRALLFGELDGCVLLEALDAWVPGTATGQLVGGNVAVLAASAGTHDLVPAAGAIAFLEDTGQPAFVLDRGLTQLLRAGWFDEVAGVLLGQFTMADAPVAVEAVLRDRLVGLGVPVWVGGDFGHVETNRALPIGAEAELGGGALRLL